MSTMLSEETATDPRRQLKLGESAGGFRLALANFNGPFDVLLHLITKRELDITEVALAEVTDEFIAYLRELQAASAESGSDGMKILDETTEFLVVASTLLDLKAARLLPRGEMADEEDFELLEARDLLFARLLQYKAFKQAAAFLGERYTAEGARHPREVSLEPQFAALLPELVFTIGPDALAAMAAKALAPKPEPATGSGSGTCMARTSPSPRKPSRSPPCSKPAARWFSPSWSRTRRRSWWSSCVFWHCWRCSGRKSSALRNKIRSGRC